MARSKPQAPPPVAFEPEPEPEAAVEAVAPPPPAAAGEPEILQRLERPSNWRWALVAGGVVLAAGLSAFAIRGAMRKGPKA